MAPWPEQGNEPKAPDKSSNKSVENNSSEASNVLTEKENADIDASSMVDDKQTGQNVHVSNLDDGQLKALLDEAIAYKCPKDREGKSNLFRELLQEAEANEDGDSHRSLVEVGGSRCYSNTNRRRGRRDAQVSERQTRGGSLQNLVHASNTEFDPAAGFSGFHCSGSRTARKSKRAISGVGSYGNSSVGSSVSARDCSGISVSARQREGGSLPSNVNVGGMLTLSGVDCRSSLPFDEIRTSKQLTLKRKEFVHSSSSNEFSSMPVQSSTISSSGCGSVESTNAEVLSNSSCVVPKSEFMVLDLGDFVDEKASENKDGSNNSVSVSTSLISKNTDNSHACQGNDKKDIGENSRVEEGLELEVLQCTEMTTRVPNFTSRAILEVGGNRGENNKISATLVAAGVSESMGEVDATVTFPLEILQYSEKSCNRSPAQMNGIEQTSLQLRSSYTSVKSIMSAGNSSTVSRDEKSVCTKGNDIAKRSAGSESVGKALASVAAPTSPTNIATMPMLSMQHHLSVLSLPPSSWINAPLVPDVNRLTFTHGSSKENSSEAKSKAVDENGNAVSRLESTHNSTERKGKQRKTKTNNDRNVIMSQNIEGYRGDKDLDTVLKFIESNSDGKGTNKTKNAASHNTTMNFNSKQQRNCSRFMGCGTKPRRERGSEEITADDDRVGKGRASSGKQMAKENRAKSSKLKKSNSLEEISKTTLEDLTSNSKESGENGSTSISGSYKNDGSSILMRRPNKRSTVDNEEFYNEKGRVGDRRSWGTEEAQQYYCNDGVTVSADEGSSECIQNSRKMRVDRTTVNSDEMHVSDQEESFSVTKFSTMGSGASEETEFHVVTKRQRKKKGRSSSGGRGTNNGRGGCIFDDSWRSCQHNSPSCFQSKDGSSSYQRKTFTNTSSGFPPHDRTVERDNGGVMLYTQYRHHRPRSPELRRKSTSSVPPSDKSDSSDLDSVHSLPVSSTTPKLTLDQTSTSNGSTPQASYADIARMASTNIPSAPTYSHNYVNINLNTSRWPIMGMPKTMGTSNPATCTSSCSLSPSSNSTITLPVVNNNPQFITGPKLNIGAPPVSGSKATVFSVNNSGLVSNANLPSVCNTSVADDVNTTISHKEPGSYDSALDNAVVCKSQLINSSTLDTRTKKDAMTNTSLEYCTVSPVSLSDKDSGPKNTKCSSYVETVKFLRDGDYPSLEESVCCDKSKNNRDSQSHGSQLSLFGESSTLLSGIINTLNNDKSENSSTKAVSECLNVKRADHLLAPNPHENQVLPVSASATTSSVSIASSASQETCATLCGGSIAEVNSVQNYVSSNNSKDTHSGKIKDKKVSIHGSLPPVIILDESDPSNSYSDGLTTISGLTFGFEVNEQLLMSNIVDDDFESKVCTPVYPVDSENPTTAIEEANPPVESTQATTPLKPGEGFSARYREPLIQPDNHDKVVSFVGLAWDDILKEMNCTPIHSVGKIQYYKGQ